MYLVNDSIYALGQFIIGVDVAIGMNDDWPKDDDISLMEWVEHKYKICNSTWNWTRILHHVAGTEQKALALFFEIWPEYLDGKASYPKGKPRTGYGHPEKSVTDDFWAFLYDQQWPT